MDRREDRYNIRALRVAGLLRYRSQRRGEGAITVFDAFWNDVKYAFEM